MNSTSMTFSATGPLGHQWFPVACSADVQHAPAAVRLLGADLVLWRSPSGAVVAAPDRCTHSKRALSKGTVRDGALVCPKHGWTFGDEGHCVFKPSGLPITENAHLKAHPCEEHYGLIWVSIGDPASPVTELVCDGDERHRRIHTGVSVWQSNPVTIVEALLGEADSPFDNVTADVPFIVHGAVKLDDGAEHRRLLACAPVDGRTSLVTAIVWNGSSAHDDEAKIVGDLLADLDGVKRIAEQDGVTPSAVEIASNDGETNSADWKRRLLAFLGSANA
jgi:nitrite reductase/ring-hydroxylating ferredoxin subunit